MKPDFYIFTSWRIDRTLKENVKTFFLTWLKARRVGGKLCVGKYDGRFEPSLMIPHSRYAEKLVKSVCEATNQDCWLEQFDGGLGRLVFKDGSVTLLGLRKKAQPTKQDCTITLKGAFTYE
jgi:hypothetical protein